MPLYRLSVVGLGYVGLPLARLFAKVGHQVHGIDIDANKISLLRGHVSYLSDMTDADVRELFETERFCAESSFETVNQADVIVLCVPTPLDESGAPDLTFLLSAVHHIVPHLRQGQLIVLESSTYPGTCEELVQPILESTGMIVGRDIHLAYSPERIDPGSGWELQRIPKVVGGFSPACTEFAKRVYDTAFDQTVVVSSLKTAEITKLLENSQRFVNISLMNSMLPIARKLNVSLWEAIRAASTKPFGFTPYYPGPGIGGHCIPVDPLYLQWKAREHGLELPFIELSRQTNEIMPLYTVERLREALQHEGLAHTSVLVIGVTYKKDVNDLRESAALKVISILREEGAHVSFYDPYIRKVNIGGSDIPYVPLTAEHVKAFDCVVILTDHSNVSYDLIAEHASVILDTKHAIPGGSDRGNINYL
ncbi:MAG: nucleotide sugar dehydrogenase [Cohnella sp.]|nr:nucleotide sugar dehydrogenase [Cohnella sp.]